MANLSDHPSLRTLQNHWLDKGVLNSVRYQGLCNCCWAIAPTGTVEALRKIQERNKGRDEELVHLSIQEMIDCVKERYDENKGAEKDEVNCYPFRIGPSFKFLMEYGVCLEYQYPFVQAGGKYKGGAIQAPRLRITDFKKVDKEDIDGVCKAIDAQPLSGSMKVHVSDINIKYLEGNVYQQRAIEYGPKTLAQSIRHKQDVYGHAVMLVGYGQEDNETRYYLIKNSWGTSWGMQGYGKIECSKIYLIRRPVGPVYWSPYASSWGCASTITKKKPSKEERKKAKL